MIEFSFLLPTRGRPEQVRRFVRSVVETAARPEHVEVILCVDEDDPASHSIDCSPLAAKTVIVPPGISMGALDGACFEASSGRYVMLINDDVVIRTQGWDTDILSLFRGYPDDILLVHVNDLLFRDKLCTFPILSRRACLEIGLCPRDYHRYRLDDHIFDTYCLLAHLGHKRIVYLSEVVFEHLNHSSGKSEDAEHTFRSSDDKTYVPNQEILERDAAVYDARRDERKQNAVRLASLIEQTAAEIRAANRRHKLQGIADTRSLRRPDNVVFVPPRADRPSAGSVTVAVVTGNLHSPHARECISRIKAHTTDFDLVILDNNGSGNFNHPREMNKVLESATTDFVVLLDDDVYVEPGWLTGLLRAVDEKTGVVVPMHKDGAGNRSFSGIYLMGDDWGTHEHLLDVPSAPRVVQCACSALLLVDRRKCGHVRFEEQFSKYFLDIDYSLRIWESGSRLVCTPDVTVTHLGGATMPRHTKKSQLLFNADLPVFVREWIDNQRLERLKSEVWHRHPQIQELCEIPRRIRRLAEYDARASLSALEAEIAKCHDQSAPYPLFRGLLVTSLRRRQRVSQERGDSRQSQICRSWIRTLQNTPEVFGGPIPQLVGSRKGYNLVQCGDQAIGVSPTLGAVDVRNPETLASPGVLIADSLAALRELVDGSPLSTAEEVAVCEPSEAAPGEPARSPLQNRYFASRRAVKRYLAKLGFEFDGVFSLEAVVRGRYLRLDPGSRLGVGWGKISHLAARSKRIPAKLGQAARGSKRLLAGALAATGARSSAGPVAKIPQAGRRNGSPGAQPRCDLPRSGEFDNVTAHAAELVVRNHAGFDIFHFNTKYFGVHAGQGTFNLQRVRSGEQGAYFVGNTIKEVTSEIDRVASQTSKPKALVVCGLPRQELLNHLPYFNDLDVQFLVSADERREYRSHPAHVYANAQGRTPSEFDLSQLSPALLAKLQAERFDVVVLPSDRVAWRLLHAERLAIALSARLTITFDDGRRETYKGEDLHRIIYNAAYLNSMFRFVPDLAGKRILDVGCSDGLVCNLLLGERPDAVVGIDVLETVGCRYPHPQITYHRMDATHTDFPDKAFDVCVSIATFEHVPDPPAVFREMKRVTASGGYCYIQAGPLYHSPFGHHMFGFFDELPWIHLRRTKSEIVAYARQTGADRRIEETFGKDIGRYVDEMINREHVNQRFFQEYGIDEFLKSEKCELVFFHQSLEGEKLLTPEILSELSAYDRDDLVAHGFEVLFRVP